MNSLPKGLVFSFLFLIAFGTVNAGCSVFCYSIDDCNTKLSNLSYSEVCLANDLVGGPSSVLSGQVSLNCLGYSISNTPVTLAGPHPSMTNCNVTISSYEIVVGSAVSLESFDLSGGGSFSNNHVSYVRGSCVSIDGPNKLITQNVFDGCANDAISVTHANASVFSYNNISNSDVGANLEQFRGGSINNNVITNTVRGGLNIKGCNGTEIQNNLLVNTSNGASTDYSFSVASSTNCIIKNNIINNTQTGFNVYDSSNSNIFENNYVTNLYYPSDSAGHGFVLIGADRNYFYNNHVINNSGDGFLVQYSDHNEFVSNNITKNYLDGFYFSRSENNTVDYNTIENVSYSGVVEQAGHGISATDSQLFIRYNDINSIQKAGVYLLRCVNCYVGYNQLHNSFYGVYSTNSNLSVFSYNRIYDNDAGIVFYQTNGSDVSYNNVSGNKDGIMLGSSPNIRLNHNEIYNNKLSGVYVEDSTNFNSTNDHLYNNTEFDLFFTVSSSYPLVNMSVFTSNLIIDNPYGNYNKYTRLAIQDVLENGTAYSIKWFNEDDITLPDETAITFAGKLVNISSLTPGVSIDRITWQWLDSEVIHYYNESDFELWVYDGAWTLLNDTPDTVANTLSISNLVPSSTYAILQNTSGLFNGSLVNLYKANVTNVTHLERWGSNISGTPVITEGGNITSINTYSEQLTDRWAAFFGNVSIDIYLTDNDSATTNYLFKWHWTPDNSGVLCVSTNSTLGTINITGANSFDIDVAWGFDSSSSDCAEKTFNNTNCSLVFGNVVVDNADYANTGTAGVFRTCAFKTKLVPKKDELLFCTAINSTGQAYSGVPANYELIVPTSYGYNVFETYYFYVSVP